MFQKVLIGILLLMILSTILVLLHDHSQKTTILTTNPQTAITPGSPIPQTTLRLVPNPAQPDSLGNVKLNVAAITEANKISSVHFIVTYDPTVLKLVDVGGDDAFAKAQVTIKKIDEAKGTIELGLSIHSNKTKVMQGNDHVADIGFKPLRYTGTTNVKIAGVAVQAFGIDHSVLKNSVSTTINLTR